MRVTRATLLFTLAALLASAAILPMAASAIGTKERYSGRTARATLVNADGETVGLARFTQRRDGAVHVVVQVFGLSKGLHGIHVHSVGACSPTFAAAGAHFNPDGLHHGNHAGDLGNIRVPESGRTGLSVTTTNFTLSDGHYSLFDFDGSALIIHAGQDDLVTDPTGNSGARVVCGVISSD
jgi:Cu-Zn family superoxide dismutase